MFCKNCGAFIDDEDARFCSECGNDLTAQKKELEQVNNISEQKEVIQPEVAVAQPEIITRPEATETQTVIISQPEVAVAQPEIITQPEVEEKKKSRGGFIAFAVIFGIISIAASVCSLIDEIGGDKEVAVIALAGCYIAAALIVIVYAITKSKAVGIIKGILMLGLIAADLVFSGVYTYKSWIDVLKCEDGFLDKYSAIIIIAGFSLLYLFLLLDGIKSIFSLKKITSFISLIGYITMILLAAASAILIIAFDSSMLLNIVPPLTNIIAFIIAGIFAGVARKRI